MFIRRSELRTSALERAQRIREQQEQTPSSFSFKVLKRRSTDLQTYLMTFAIQSSYESNERHAARGGAGSPRASALNTLGALSRNIPLPSMKGQGGECR